MAPTPPTPPAAPRRGTKHSPAAHDARFRQERLEVYARHQEAIAALSQLALQDGDIESRLDRSIEQVAAALQVDFVRILELQPDAKSFLPRSATRGAPRDAEKDSQGRAENKDHAADELITLIADIPGTGP